LLPVNKLSQGQAMMKIQQQRQQPEVQLLLNQELVLLSKLAVNMPRTN
jgi:hypothetical protein